MTIYNIWLVCHLPELLSSPFTDCRVTDWQFWQQKFALTSSMVTQSASNTVLKPLSNCGSVPIFNRDSFGSLLKIQIYITFTLLHVQNCQDFLQPEERINFPLHSTDITCSSSIIWHIEWLSERHCVVGAYAKHP